MVSQGRRRVVVDSQIHIWGADTPERPWPGISWNGKRAEPQRETPLGAEEVLSAMDQAGVARAILVPPSWEGDRNDLALAAAARWPDRFAVMGRFADHAPVDALRAWRDQPGMLGVRLIFGPGSTWVTEGADHAFWRVAAEAGVPVMVAPVENNGLVGRIADQYPEVRIALDHMGTGIVAPGADEFALEDEILALASRPNIAVKLSAVPCHSDRPGRPWDDVTPHIKRLFDAFGPDRCFWGSDLSRLPCPYGDLVRFFEEDLPWMTEKELDRVMGAAILDWLDWHP